MARVVLAMSGGVDSSVAAKLLLDAGHEVIGVFMRHGEASAQACQVPNDAPAELRTHLPIVQPGATVQPEGGRADHKQGCCSASDAADARRVAAKLGIRFYALDLQADFRRIVDYFVDDYLAGRTPNPCVKCNHWIKFGRLFDYADSVEAEYVATGHYARIIRRDGASDPELHRGLGREKDQSYALFGIHRRRLSRMLLPVGDYTKPEIRQMAAEIGLGVATKKDSQEICFVTSGHHSDFVRARRPEFASHAAGNIVTTEGHVVGQHNGVDAFTIGQRKGLGIAMGEPYFVVQIDAAEKRVVIGRKESLAKSGLTAGEANWLVDPVSLPHSVFVQIRYNGLPKPATLHIDSTAPDTFKVQFRQPQLAVAPGQAAVIYDETRVLGGGWIR
jgi:tRNA-specific 2-thiouridylase